ncbi:MAG: FecR domain-containing protein [Myxococcales bacterium]
MNLPPELYSLTRFARNQRHGELTPRLDADSWAELTRRRAARRQHEFRLRAVLGGLSLATALVVMVWFTRSEDSLQYREEVFAQAAGSPQRELVFSDGSRVAVQPGATLEVESVTPAGAHLKLRHGRSSLAITHREGANWSVQAGPYRVRVTGTAFDVVWSGREGIFEVTMRHGSVVVSGPLAGEGLTLKAGQRLRAAPRLRRLAVERVNDEVRTALAEPVAGKPAVTTPAVQQPAEPNTPAVAAVPTRPLHGWSQQVERGQYQEVLRQANARGLGRSLRERSAPDLSALADAARVAHRDDVARRALLALRERFPRTPQAQNAAFFLARLLPDTQALDWYERYVEESPNGAYVSQALGRRMLIQQSRGDAAQAKRAAAQYLARNPDGTYASQARTILANEGAAP